jgi:hypothetical protein
VSGTVVSTDFASGSETCDIHRVGTYTSHVGHGFRTNYRYPGFFWLDMTIHGQVTRTYSGPNCPVVRALEEFDTDVEMACGTAYQPTIQKQGKRWIAYIGHHGGTQPNPLIARPETNGTSIVDVTDPKRPKYLAREPPVESPLAQCMPQSLPRADIHSYAPFKIIQTPGLIAFHTRSTVRTAKSPSRC